MMMTWDDLREAQAAGIIIAPHTTNHFILSRLSTEKKKATIVNSINAIQRNLGITPILFCYPDGSPDSFDTESIETLEENGIRYAFTTETGFNKDLSENYYLKRIGINPSDPIPVVALKIAMALR